MPRTVTLDDELEASLRWFLTWRKRMLDRCAHLTPEECADDADFDDARFMMQDYAFHVALQLAAQLGDEEAAQTWRTMIADRSR